MKNLKVFFFITILFLNYSGQAQLSAGSSGFYIASNTNVIIDSLVVIPSADATFTNTNIVRTSTPILSPTGSSIVRVHTFSSPISVTGTVGLFWLTSELNGNVASQLAFVYQRSADRAYITSTNSTLNLGARYISQAMTGIPVIKVSATNSNVTLPILLSAYSAKAEGTRTKIEWTTTSELNADHYNVERSADGINFETITTVKSLNYDVTHTYSIYDNTPLEGENYYRLTQYDLDGSKKLFDVKVVDFKGINLLTVLAYPNPVIKTLSIKLQNYSGTNVNVLLYDFHGKLIHKETIVTGSGQSVYPINLSSKPLSGDYILKVTGTNGLNESLKVTVL